MPRAAPKGRRCTICQHPQRPNIDLAIATGISRRLIAARFKVSADAAWRHGRAHLTSEIRAALATKVLAREGDMRRILLEEGTGVVGGRNSLAGTRGTRLRARYWGDCYPRDQVLTVPPGALGLCQIAIRAIGSRQ